ncbi:restriction endonuclease [Streptomyces sp. NPDC059169]|uniref:restriction endonuclease n=1 Tax=unclassified Streptomyces TaxID=2593676 RepID=UPI0034073A7D
MFEEDGSLDPFLKFLLYGILTLAIGKMLWQWLTETAVPWIVNEPWAWVTSHLWWTGAISAGLLLLVVGSVKAGLLALDYTTGHSAPLPTASTSHVEQEAPCEPTFRMWQLETMTPTEFEEACAELLIRDGFTEVQRVGGAGDLGADVRARDSDGDLVIIQCKRYRARVVSGHVQQFNGTARPHHGADVAIMIGLAGFTDPAAAFADQHRITLLGRREIKKWAHGTHLYKAATVRT